MAKNVQLYDYTGTTKLYPTTVAQEVFLDGEQVSTILTDQNTVILDHETRITDLEEGKGVIAELQSQVNDIVSDVSGHETRITDLEEGKGVIAELQSQVNTLEEGVLENTLDISSIKSENATRDLRITDHETRITDLEYNMIAVIELTQAEYDSLDEYQFNTLYYITDGTSVIDELIARVSALENP